MQSRVSRSVAPAKASTVLPGSGQLNPVQPGDIILNCIARAMGSEIFATRRVVFNLALYAMFNTLPDGAVVDEAALDSAIILALSSGTGRNLVFLLDNGLGPNILVRMAQWVRGHTGRHG